MRTVSAEVIFVLSPIVSKVLLFQVFLCKKILCQVSLTFAGASWEPGDSAFQSNLCVWGWAGERALCVGGQGGELLAEGTKQGRSKGGNRKVVRPLQSEEFSWSKNPAEIRSLFSLKKYSFNNPGLPGINPAYTEGAEVCWLVLQTWDLSPCQIIHTRVFLTCTRLPENCRVGLCPPLFSY